MHQLPAISNSILFEELMCDLMNAVEQTSSYDLFGRNGQKQFGIDIISHEKSTVIQCKQISIYLPKDGTFPKLENEFKNSLAQAVNSSVSFNRFIFANTYVPHVAMQILSGELSQGYSRQVEYWAWNKIERLILEHPSVLRKYYPTLFNHFDITIPRVTIDSKQCAYEHAQEGVNSFTFLKSSRLSSYPILDFTFINHSQETVLLASVECQYHNLPTGISGPGRAGIVEVTGKYVISFEPNSKTGKLFFDDPLYAESAQPLRLQLQLENMFDDPVELGVTFQFSNQTVRCPRIYFNCTEDSQGIIIRVLS